MAQDFFEQLHAAVKQAESRGQRYDEKGKLLTSPKGAEGEMQVMPKTQLDPGYGVVPAKTRTPDEIARVGRDYLKAMVDKYGDTQKALIAYNWGPGNTDKWLAKGADPKVLPAETQKYVSDITGMLGGKKMRVAEGSTGPAVASDVQELAKNAGPGYKAALAMMFLADDKPKTDEEDIWKEAETPDDESYATPNALAGLDLGYQSPFPVAQAPAAQQLAQFARGGAVHRADGSPETGELTQAEIDAASRPAFVTPKSGLNRQQGPISQALNSGEAYPAIARGIAETPYNVVGAPVDLATLAMRPFGYKEEKPVMGSDWIKEKMTKYGIRPGEEANPTLQGFRTVGELGASVVNPGPVAAKVGQAAEKGIAATGKEVARQMLRGMEGEGPLTSISPPILYAREPGKAAAGPIFSHTPSNEAPFVGRLDEYISALPGPVQKQQFFGQLKGKFRDYEIGRAEEALKDLPDNAKLTPSDLLNRVKEVYDPGRYKTTVLPPDPEASAYNNRWRSADNIFYNKDTDEGVHLGVIHLNQDVVPEVAQRQMVANDAARAVKLMNNDYYIGRYPEKMDALENFLKTSGVQLEPELAKKIETGTAQYRKISNYENEMKAAKDKLLYPTLDPRYDELHDMYKAKLQETNPTIAHYAARVQNDGLVVRDLANEANAWLQKNGYKPVALPDFVNIKTPSAHGLLDADFGKSVHAAFLPAKEQVGLADNNLAKYMKGTEEQFRKAIGHELPYMGQHESLGGGPAQVAFSRYSEHTSNIPGMGPTQGIYVHELQSDMLDDLRKLGPKRASKAGDQEEYADIVKKLEGLEKSRAEAYNAGNSKLAEELDNQIVSAGGRADVLSKRIQSHNTNYSMNEAFHKMETGGKTTQQLMAKNAIVGAIQQGKNFVAFPGKESAQAKLYEKLPRNLKDVAKDLGPGFEIRPVELEGPMGKSMHTAIVWGPEAAARIQKKGVPFKDGGSVDKANIDHRKYL